MNWRQTVLHNETLSQNLFELTKTEHNILKLKIYGKMRQSLVASINTLLWVPGLLLPGAGKKKKVKLKTKEVKEKSEQKSDKTVKHQRKRDWQSAALSEDQHDQDAFSSSDQEGKLCILLGSVMQTGMYNTMAPQKRPVSEIMNHS